MIIDFHHHLVCEDGYVENLLRAMDSVGIDKTCLSALGPEFTDRWVEGGPERPAGDNDAVARAMRDHPDRFIGLGYVRLGLSSPDDVDRLHNQGFLGIKTIIPRKDYDDEEFYPVYERIQALEMPILFHTGVIRMGRPLPDEKISSAKMRPILIETLGHQFPELKMVMAHLGVPWHDEAATIARVQTNTYVDLSGSLEGWRSTKSIEWFKQILYWKGAHRKVVFGSDVYFTKVAAAFQDYQRILDDMGWSAAQQADVFGNNAATLLGLA